MGHDQRRTDVEGAGYVVLCTSAFCFVLGGIGGSLLTLFITSLF